MDTLLCKAIYIVSLVHQSNAIAQTQHCMYMHGTYMHDGSLGDMGIVDCVGSHI